MPAGPVGERRVNGTHRCRQLLTGDSRCRVGQLEYGPHGFGRGDGAGRPQGGGGFSQLPGVKVRGRVLRMGMQGPGSGDEVLGGAAELLDGGVGGVRVEQRVRSRFLLVFEVAVPRGGERVGGGCTSCLQGVPDRLLGRGQPGPGGVVLGG